MKTPKFRNVDEMLDYIPEDELIVSLHLRELIKDVLPTIEEKLSYNVPFYALNASICYIWPASVLWGNRKTYHGVRLGFTKGYLLSDPQNVLDKSNRKQMFAMDILNLVDFERDRNAIVTLLKNAAEVDSQMLKEKRMQGKFTS